IQPPPDIGAAIANPPLLIPPDIQPIAGVNTAPPMIAMTINEPPILVFGPSPFSPRAKIVGNISDIKRLVRKMAHSPIHPGFSTPTDARMTLTTAYAPISLLGAI